MPGSILNRERRGIGMLNRKILFVAFASVFVGALAMACGSDSPAAAPTAPPSSPAPQAQSTQSPTQPASEPTTAPSPEPEPTAAAAPDEGSLPFTWDIEDIDTGAKPALALTSDGTPHVAYMLEAMPGFVKNAVRNGAS
jgi:type IV secretory pathway VirB10-like protein